MDVERIIEEIEYLQEMFEAPDIRPLSASAISAANRRHDEMLAHSPWFRLWQRYGICCRSESPILQLSESHTNPPGTAELPSSRVFFRSCSPRDVADRNYWRRKCNLCARPEDLPFS